MLLNIGSIIGNYLKAAEVGSESLLAEVTERAGDIDPDRVEAARLKLGLSEAAYRRGKAEYLAAVSRKVSGDRS